MKEFIIQALNDAMVNVEKRTPKTKKKTICEDISDISPFKIVEFMREYNIPDNAHFSCDGYEDGVYNPCLCYDIEVETTEKERLVFKKRVFSTPAFQNLYHLLIKNGYKRVGFNSGLLKEFDDTTVYDMYINADFDRLVKYYSLSFVLDNPIF